MKRLSIKVKLTIIYTFLMTLVVCAVLIVLFSLSNQEILSSVQSQLEEEVAGAREYIRYRDGALEFDSDLLELDHGIYLSIYSSDGTLLYGKIPYGFDNSAVFEDGSIRKFQGRDDVQFYVMDIYYYITDYGVVDIRGVTSITEAEANFVGTMRLALILLPLIVILTSVLAYRVAARFDKMLAKIEAGMKREQQFTSDVAHELRTPLSTMTLQCETLLDDETLNPEARNGVEVLYRKTGYLSQIISQLLILSRADQGRAQIEIEPVNFSDIALMASEEVQVYAMENDITINTQIEPDIYIQGDETLLIRFWMNLLNNAVKYGRNGGHVWVMVQKSGGEIVGEIKDDGIGISKNDLPHIWERFYQADKSRSGTESSGLGLSMVQWIVKVHGGKITVYSTVGEGTCFKFAFPYQQ